MATKPKSSLPPSSSRPVLWPHQAQTKKFCKREKRVLDTSDPGTGKTRSHIEAYAEENPVTRGRLLIVCPMGLMTSAWANDIERFAPQLSYSLAYADQRAEAFAMKTDVVIINTDGVKWLNDQRKTAAGRKLLAEFGWLIIDEITTFKHRTSQRSKAMYKLRTNFHTRRGLTGTPNANSVTELWHQMMILDDGKRLGTSFFHFRNSVQEPTQTGPDPRHLTWDDRPGAQLAVSGLLKDITIRHQFEDVMTHVPPHHRDVKSFRLNAKTQRLYGRLEDECVLALNDKKINAVHAASLRSKLLQLASGAVYTSEGDGTYTVVDKQRYELIADLVEERKHSLVFFRWKHQRDLLAAEFKRRKLRFAIIDGNVPAYERSKIVADYQKGLYDTLLLHPQTGAHGLTLTMGDTTIVASPIYEADLLKQLIHRIYRGEQNKVTNTILVKAEGTVEELVYARLDTKYGRMVDLLDLMKERGKIK